MKKQNLYIVAICEPPSTATSSLGSLQGQPIPKNVWKGASGIAKAMGLFSPLEAGTTQLGARRFQLALGSAHLATSTQSYDQPDKGFHQVRERTEISTECAWTSQSSGWRGQSTCPEQANTIAAIMDNLQICSEGLGIQNSLNDTSNRYLRCTRLRKGLIKSFEEPNLKSHVLHQKSKQNRYFQV